jgi:hypothetical protein
LSAGDAEFASRYVFEFTDTLRGTVEHFGYLFMAQANEYQDTNSDILFIQVLCLQRSG